MRQSFGHAENEDMTEELRKRLQVPNGLTHPFFLLIGIVFQAWSVNYICREGHVWALR